jgi:Predicted symporter
MILILLGKPEVNWSEGLGKLKATSGLFPSFNAESDKLIDAPGFNLIIMILLTSFGFWGLPQSIHKFYAIRDERAIKQATVISTVFAAIIGCGAYFTGALVPLFLERGDFGSMDTAVPIMLTKALPPVMLGLIMVLVLAASMSTLASLALAGSSSIAIDLYKGYINPDADDKKVKTLLRVLCLCFVVLSALLAIAQIDVIVTLMSLSWGTLAGCFIGPYVLGLYSKKINKGGAWISIISGILITLLLILVFGFVDTPDGTKFGAVLKAGIGRSPLIGVIAMFASFAVTVVGSLVFKNKCPDYDFPKEEETKVETE